MKTSFNMKKGGEDFCRQIFPKTRPISPVNVPSGKINRIHYRVLFKYKNERTLHRGKSGPVLIIVYIIHIMYELCSHQYCPLPMIKSNYQFI